MQIVRYGVNGLVATFVHYSVLYFCIEIYSINSVGLANFIASVFGVLVSFFGNRFFVFHTTEDFLSKQLLGFLILYGLIAIMHGTLLHIWSDIYELNYNVGFLMAVIIQFFLGYFCSKYVVFGD